MIGDIPLKKLQYTTAEADFSGKKYLGLDKTPIGVRSTGKESDEIL